MSDQLKTESGCSAVQLTAGLCVTHAEIGKRRCELDAERREFMQGAMRDFDAAQRPERKSLREACGQIGHNWRFTNHGPLGDPWFSCTVCGESKVERDA